MKEFKEKDLKELIDMQFKIAGHTDINYEKIKNIDDWFIKYTTTTIKEKEFIEWLRKYLKSFIYKQRVEKEIGRFILNYGLKIKDDMESD